MTIDLPVFPELEPANNTDIESSNNTDGPEQKDDALEYDYIEPEVKYIDTTPGITTVQPLDQNFSVRKTQDPNLFLLMGA